MQDEDKKKQEESTEEDNVVEFEFNDDGEEDLKKTLKKLRADLKEAQKQKEEYLTGWQKERADFVNYKKEESARQANMSLSLREHMLNRFLTVIDSFDMAFANRELWEKVDESWRKGVEYIHSQMNSIFEEYGVKEVGAVGESFDPASHESIEMLPTDKKEKNHTVALVVQKGYKLGDRVMRPAKVKVYEYQSGGE